MAIDKVNTAAAGRTAQNIGADKGIASDKDGVSFGSMVKGLSDAVETCRKSECIGHYG